MIQKLVQLTTLLLFSSAAISQVVTGKLQSPVLNEISGVVESKKYKGRLYVHNDSGDGNRFYLINKKGALISTISFDTDARVKDCEDIDLGPGPAAGASYIYLADIGDNLGFRDHIAIYRLKEPSSTADTMSVKAEKIILRYPDGARDAESIFIDPVEKMLYILSKREDSAHIYRFALAAAAGDTIVPMLCGRLKFDSSKKKDWLVSAAMSADGKQVLVKTINNVYYWQRKKMEPVYQTLQRKPIRQSLYEPHGQEEAIAFAADAKHYYILSEGKSSPIWLYPLQTANVQSKAAKPGKR